MSINAHGFVTQEILYSPMIRRTCSVCGAKRKIDFLIQRAIVSVGEPIRWRCSAGCFPS